jgi:hypothetical protein
MFAALLMFVVLLMFAALHKSHDFLIMFCSLFQRLMISKCELPNVNVGFFMNTGKPFLHTKQFATSCSFPRRWLPFPFHFFALSIVGSCTRLLGEHVQKVSQHLIARIVRL